MHRVAYFLLGLLIAILPVAQTFAVEKIVRLTSLEWPPYTGEALPEQGASAIVAKAAFKAMGYTLIVEVFPWSRALHLARTSASYQGYFPEYYSADNAKEFIYSASMGEGPLGFAERIDQPVTWKSLDDLTRYSIGVVNDYVNTEEFDRRIAMKNLNADVASSDTSNLLKLAVKRIDLAVVDKHVFNYLLKTPELNTARDKLRFNERVLENKQLYVCFKSGAEGARLAKIFNAGLKKINVAAIMAQHTR